MLNSSSTITSFYLRVVSCPSSCLPSPPLPPGVHAYLAVLTLGRKPSPITINILPQTKSLFILSLPLSLPKLLATYTYFYPLKKKKKFSPIVIPLCCTIKIHVNILLIHLYCAQERDVNRDPSLSQSCVQPGDQPRSSNTTQLYAIFRPPSLYDS